jgi:parvulin-like peptidyl-prolyl isomerase
VFGLASGEWSEPVRSPFGLHLVRIDERKASTLPPLEELRRIAFRALRAERADQRFAQGLVRLRSLYEVQIEGDAAARADVPTG